jgi:hypothetical protein
MTILYETVGSAAVNSAQGLVNTSSVNEGLWFRAYKLVVNRMALTLGAAAVGLGFVTRQGALRYQTAASADDVLYVIVKRTLADGTTVRNVERLHSRYLGDL